jgi:hypothetical protein
VCRAQAAEDARSVIHEALEKAGSMLRGLRESEESLRRMFDSGALSHRMPLPHFSADQTGPIPTPVPEQVTTQSVAAHHNGHQTTELDPS